MYVTGKGSAIQTKSEQQLARTKLDLVYAIKDHVWNLRGSRKVMVPCIGLTPLAFVPME